ncbi:MAG: hypothetical protein KAS17_11065 [Victivallaceae bacterium]|nr:hypothetical protein [Victivallaceae bacterium]
MNKKQTRRSNLKKEQKDLIAKMEKIIPPELFDAVDRAYLQNYHSPVYSYTTSANGSNA